MEKSKLGEVGIYDIFRSPALVEKTCFDDIMSPTCDISSDACDILSTPAERISFKIPMGIVEKVMEDRYAGDGTIHPSEHLLKLKDFCELFEVAGLSREDAMKKLFIISLKGKAYEWFRMLKDGRSIEWKELESLFIRKFYPPCEMHRDRNYIYNFHPHDGESIAQAWGRLKLLIDKCPIHELPDNVIINNFYARLSGQYKDRLDAYCGGSFTNKEEGIKKEILDIIQKNAEDWDIDKGKESGINYEYDCIKAFAETTAFQEFSAQYGIDPQGNVDYLKKIAAHLGVPKKIGTIIMNLLKMIA
jgi:hypothetical protein